MFLSSLDNKWNPFFLFFKIIVVKLSFILSPFLVKSRITRAHVHLCQLWKLRVYNRRMTILSEGSARQVIKLLSLLQCSWQWEFHLFLETNKRNSRVTIYNISNDSSENCSEKNSEKKTPYCTRLDWVILAEFLRKNYSNSYSLKYSKLKWYCAQLKTQLKLNRLTSFTLGTYKSHLLIILLIRRLFSNWRTFVNSLLRFIIRLVNQKLRQQFPSLQNWKFWAAISIHELQRTIDLLLLTWNNNYFTAYLLQNTSK